MEDHDIPQNVDQFAAAGGALSGGNGLPLLMHRPISTANPMCALDRQALSWTRINSSGCLPPRRSGAASVVVKGRLYMFGVSSQIWAILYNT